MADLSKSEREQHNENKATHRLEEIEEPFILTAMVSLVGGTLWLWLRNDLLVQYFYQGELLALTHLVTLGFITSLMMGVLYRLSPVAIGVGARYRWLGRAQFVVFFIGTVGMVVHFWMGEWSGMAWATLLVLVAALLQVVNFASLWKPVRKGHWVARYVAASLVNLVLTASLGVLLGFNKALSLDFSLVPGRFPASLFAHAHLAAAGWVTMMIFGFQLKLVPTTVGRRSSIPLRFWLLEIGTLGLVATLLSDRPWPAPFALLLLAAVLWQAFGPIKALVTGRAREWETLPLLFLVGVAITGVALALGLPGREDPLRGRVQLAYGYAAIFGWIVLTVTTVAFKLFPMWVWQERFQSDFGKRPVPGMKELYSHPLRNVANGMLATGVVGTMIGVVLETPSLLRVAPGLVFLGVVGFAVNFVRMARWALLKLEYHPTEEDWQKFREMFPDRD